MFCVVKKLVNLFKGVELNIQLEFVSVKGLKGILLLLKVVGVEIIVENGVVNLVVNDLLLIVFIGIVCVILVNMVYGVIEGFECKFELVGVGYCVVMQGKDLNLLFGFLYLVVFVVLEGIILLILIQIEIVVQGMDKQQVGEVVVKICGYCLLEFYKGKGVKYVGEVIICKEVKKV